MYKQFDSKTSLYVPHRILLKRVVAHFLAINTERLSYEGIPRKDQEEM